MGVLTIWWWIFIGYQCKTKTKLHWLPLNSIYKSINHYMQYKNSNFVTNFKATFRPTTSTSFKFRFNELWLTEQLGIKKWQSREHKINIIPYKNKIQLPDSASNINLFKGNTNYLLPHMTIMHTFDSKLPKQDDHNIKYKYSQFSINI
jgi:glycopeptide antibiotics resistance protein